MYYTKIYAVFFFFEEMAEEYMNSVQEEKERIEAEKAAAKKTSEKR